MSARARVAAVAAAALVAVAGCGQVAALAPAAPAPDDAAALAALEARAVDPGAKYQRSAFGQRWRDVDRNGCDQRNDTLARDMTGVVRGRGGCRVLSGTLVDPYTARVVRFVYGESSDDVEIDHRVSLADAWRSGAYRWTGDQRERYANDVDRVLVATDGPTNQRKSDRTIDEWSAWAPPSAGAECDYARRVVAIKSWYRLSVRVAERRALARALSSCGGSS